MTFVDGGLLSNYPITIFVDAGTVSSTDFSLPRETQDQLVQWGREAAEKFLADSDPDD